LGVVGLKVPHGLLVLLHVEVGVFAEIVVLALLVTHWSSKRSIIIRLSEFRLLITIKAQATLARLWASLMLPG
jgi:hypothetical protein